MKITKIAAAFLALAWIVGSYEGRIALWQAGQNQPIRVFPYSTASLPPADRQALDQGIPIESKEDLIRLLEDYLS